MGWTTQRGIFSGWVFLATFCRQMTQSQHGCAWEPQQGCPHSRQAPERRPRERSWALSPQLPPPSAAGVGGTSCPPQRPRPGRDPQPLP